jgi:predicted RNase H-like HicB family nuclease
MRKPIKMTVEKSDTGYIAYADKHSVYTEGDTLDELKRNIIEALNLHFEDQGKEVTEDDIQVSLDLHQFFEFYDVINTKALSERIGMNRTLLTQYITGTKKPSQKQVSKILKGVKELGKELSQLEILDA